MGGWADMQTKVLRGGSGSAIRVVIALILSAIAVSPALAQQATQDSYSDLSRYLVSGNQVVPSATAGAGAVANLSSSVVQIGQGNTATATLNGTSNVTTQYQAGANNTSTLSINGAQNTINNTQIGSSNTTAIDIAGSGNSVSNLQVGSGLSYQLQVVGKSAPVSVQQFGRK
jgi:hypothetical protein